MFQSGWTTCLVRAMSSTCLTAAQMVGATTSALIWKMPVSSALVRVECVVVRRSLLHCCNILVSNIVYANLFNHQSFYSARALHAY